MGLLLVMNDENVGSEANEGDLYGKRVEVLRQDKVKSK